MSLKKAKIDIANKESGIRKSKNKMLKKAFEQHAKFK